MLLGLASLVLGIAAASVTRTVAAALAAGRAAGAAFARGFGAVRTGMSRMFAGILAGLRALTGGMSRAWGRMTAPFSRALASMRVAWSGWVSRTIASGGIFRAFGRSMRRLGTTGGMSLMNGIASATRSLGPMLMTMAGGIAAGIVLLGPPVGAALAAAITAAVGIGVMAAGIAIAAKQSDRVQAAFRDAFQPIGREISETAMVAFEAPLIESAARFKRAWQEVGPVVKAALTKSAEFVKPLTEGLSQMIEKMVGGGGFSKILDAAGPVMSQLSTGLSRLGDAFDSFFRSIAAAGPGLAKGMIVIFAMLTSAIVALGNTIEFLSKAFDKGTELAQGYAETYAVMFGSVKGLGDAWKWAAENLALFNDSAGKTRDIMPIVGAATSGTAGAFNTSAAAAERARKALSDLTDKISGLINAQLGADQAALAFQRALDAVTQSIKDNGKNIDITTAAGQANIDVVLQAVAAAQQKREADIKLAGGEKASQQAIYAANAAFAAQIAQLEATMRKMGLTQAQIDALLGKYRDLANAPNITKTVTTNIRTVFTTEGRPTKISAGGFHEAYASGTTSARKGVALVGEDGPELVEFEGGERIRTASETEKLLASSRRLAKDSAYDMASMGRPETGAPKEARQTLVKVYIGNEEFKGYVAQVTDERADARSATMARRLNGR